jgi:hypothetical protein
VTANPWKTCCGPRARFWIDDELWQVIFRHLPQLIDRLETLLAVP